jgi:hypothetical protein
MQNSCLSRSTMLGAGNNVACLLFRRVALPSLRTDVLGCHYAASNGKGRHVHSRSSSRTRVLPHLLRVPPPRLYRLLAWSLSVVTVPADYTFIFVHYDFVDSVIDSSSTTLAYLLRQPQIASAHPRRSAPRKCPRHLLYILTHSPERVNNISNIFHQSLSLYIVL